MTEKGVPVKLTNLKAGFEANASLAGYWEAELDPISDDFTPDEESADELLARWFKRVEEDHPSGLVPISWSVRVTGGIETIEYLPFQHMPVDDPLDEDFLTFFSWPIEVSTGEPLNWFELPVVDKLWRQGRGDKGGFIQEATGWKPAIYQPFVDLGSLKRATQP